MCQICSQSVQGLQSYDTPKLSFPIDLLSRPYNRVRTMPSDTVIWLYLLSFLRYSMSKNIATLKSRSGVRQGHWKCHHSTERFPDFLLTSHSNWGLISYRFQDRRGFQSKIATFSCTYLYFAPSLKRFPLEFGIGAGSQKLEWWCYQTDEKVWRYLQPSG